MNRDRLYLRHILDCIEKIQEYTGQVRSVFEDSVLIQDAVLRNLHTLAESTQRLSDELKEEITSVPWTEVSGFRNIIVHDYLGVDLDQVWSVLENDLPVLREALEPKLKELEVADKD